MMNLDNNMNLFKDVSTKSLESLGAFTQLNLQAWNLLAEKQMEIISLATDAGLESLNVLSTTQDVHQLSAEQTQITTALGEKLTQKNQEIVEITTKVREEFNAFAKEQVSHINEKFSVVTKKTA